MSKNTGTYYLLKEHKNSHYVEYFNFESMDFSKNAHKGVSLAALDSMTSLFSNGKELNNYFCRTEYADDDFPYEFKIEYNDRRKKGPVYMPVIFNDPKISAMSKLSDGGVDFTNGANYELLIEIMAMVKDSQNGFARNIFHEKNDNLRISNHNKKLIAEIAYSKNDVSFGDIMDSFKNYKEFRNLYLSYKERDNNRNTNSIKDALKKLKI